MTFTELVSKIQSKFPFKILVPSPYRLCDYKVAYGHIFEEELNNLLITIADLKDILANEERILEIIRNELLEMKEKIW